MKRILSLVLAMVMVLGSFSAVFAVEPTVADEAVKVLMDLGVLTEGKLDQEFKRQDTIVLLSRLMGEEEVAKDFPSEELAFADVIDPFYTGYVAWAVANKLTDGKTATKFGFDDKLKTQELAMFVLRVLGYDDVEYDKALEKAKELGLLVNVAEGTIIKRGDMAVMTLNALAVNPKDSTVTLAEKLGFVLPTPEVSTDIEITSAKAIANNKVEVKVKAEVTASVADFVIVKKGSTTELEVKDVVKESAKVFVLETEALVAGTSYSVKSNDKSLNFTGVVADKTAPTVKSIKGVDTNTFEVEFSDVMDSATATKVANYTFDKDLKVVSVELSGSRKVITLTTDAAKKNTTYKLTIEGITNSDGVVMKKISQNVRAMEYTTAPTIKGTPRVISSTLVEVTFNAGAFGMNAESLEKVENYSIEGLEVTEAKAFDLDGDDLYEVVLLTTEEQEVNKSYKLTVAGVTEDSVLKNALKAKTLSFRGMRADKTAPTVISAIGANGNEVKVMFNDASAMGIGSMTDVSNYKITYKDGSQTLELAISEAEALDDEYPDMYDNASKGVVLKTEEQIDKKAYVIEISDVEDEYGNAMKSTRKMTFTGTTEDVTPPTVKSVKHTGSSVVIEFADSSALNATIVKDPTNYTINGDVGSAITASYKASTKTVTLTTGSLTANKSYTVTIENIEDKYGNLMPSRKASFVAIASSLDTTAPSFSYAYAENSEEVHISFDENIAVYPSTITVGGLTLTYSGKINDGTTVVYTVPLNTMASITYTFATAIFEDAAGNQVDITGETFAGIANVGNDIPTVEYVEQTNAKTIVISFSEPVKLNTTAGNITIAGQTGTASKVETTSNTHETEWKVVFANKLTYNIEYTATLNAVDLGGKTLSTHKFIADYYDDVAPSIVGVTAVDNATIVVEYDEDLEHPGTYEIYYLDKNNNKVKMTKPSTIMTAKNKVSISYPNMNGSEIYYLTVKVGVVDYAANREKADGTEWDFLGSDVLQTKDYITGVSIINAKSIKVNANYTMGAIVVYEVYDTDNDYTVQVGGSAGGSSPVAITTNVPLLDGVTYRIEADGLTFTFKGVTPDLGLELIGGVVTSYGNAIDAAYTVAIKDITGNIVAPTIGSTYYIDLVKDGSVVYAAKVIAE